MFDGEKFSFFLRQGHNVQAPYREHDGSSADFTVEFPTLKIGELLDKAGEGQDEIFQFVHNDRQILCTIRPLQAECNDTPLTGLDVYENHVY